MFDWNQIFAPFLTEVSHSFWYWLGFFVRDLVLLIVAVHAAANLLFTLIVLVAKKKIIVHLKSLGATIFGLFIGGAAMFTDVDRALFFTRMQALILMGLIVAIWAFILALRSRSFTSLTLHD